MPPINKNIADPPANTDTTASALSPCPVCSAQARPTYSGRDLLTNGKFITTMNRLGRQLEGVEFNETAVDVCRQNNLKVFHGSLPEAQFTNDSFDLVTARHVIEHIPDPHQFIGEIARIMCRGALLILQTPNADAFFRRQLPNTGIPTISRATLFSTTKKPCIA